VKKVMAISYLHLFSFSFFFLFGVFGLVH
jgi:hypothetical protein